MKLKAAVIKAKKFSDKFLKNTNFCVAGSIRRMSEKVNDIDFIVIDDDNEAVSNKIKKRLDKNGDVEIHSHGPRLTNLTYKNDRYDLFYVRMDELPAALMHFTGSKIFNIKMSKIAKNKGLKLNQYGLFRLSDNSKIPAKSEEEIFEALGEEYKSPQQRDK